MVTKEESFHISFQLFICTNLKSPTTTPNPNISFAGNWTITNVTFPNGTVVSIPIRNGSEIINYWDIDNSTIGNITRANTTANYTSVNATYTEYDLPNINRTLLPNETQQALAELDSEFEKGWLTKKGLARYSYEILLPFAANTSFGDALEEDSPDEVLVGVTTPHSGLKMHMGRRHGKPLVAVKRHHNSSSHIGGRHLLMVDESEEESLGLSADDEPSMSEDLHSPFIERNGFLITRKEAEFADYIVNQKRKQFSFEDDMQASIADWERRTGRVWVNGTTIPKSERSFLPWERLHLFDELLEDGADNDVDYTLPELEIQPWHSRHTLDTFGNSLKKVNSMYNKHFG